MRNNNIKMKQIKKNNIKYHIPNNKYKLIIKYNNNETFIFVKGNNKYLYFYVHKNDQLGNNFINNLDTIEL